MKYSAFILILAFRILYQPSASETAVDAFTNPTASIIAIPPAKLISVEGKIYNNKVVLDWIVGENETADQFQVEKSTDGKNFTLAALVFGTDKPAKANYQFYEKASNQKISYRIKLVNKNKQTEYSSVVEINPGA